ncbi:MAG: GNAT family N-acetyltransferase [Deltaproteobacteria bacterium]|nr:GNAT family N-acetyltransferase [Deltaproteobacteria bacterium]
MSDLKSATNRTWTLRAATEDDAEGILQLRKTTFPDEDYEKQELSYWRWEFIDNHAGTAKMFVAVDGSAIIGYYAVIPQHFICNNATLQGAIVVDVMTHPDYRFQGMFTAIGRFALQSCADTTDLEFTTGYPIRPEVIPGHLKVGWNVSFKIGIWVQPLSLQGILRSRIFVLKRHPALAKVISFLPDLLFRLSPSLNLRDNTTYKVERASRFDSQRFQHFWKNCLSTIPPECILQKRSADYLAWRYDSNPGRTYTYHLALGADDTLLGFIVTRVVEFSSIKMLVLVDACCAQKNNTDIYRLLAKDVYDLARKCQCSLSVMMVSQPNFMFPSPWKLGFLPTPFKFSFITRILKKHSIIEQNGLSWHLMWGDTDDV